MNPESPQSDSENNYAPSEQELMDAEAQIAGTVLENDELTARMLETGFVGPNGKQHVPKDFIEARKAALESEGGASSAEISEDAMVQHSPRPEDEHGSIAQIN